MKSDASTRVVDLFAVIARDCTPTPARHRARVLFAPVLHDPDVIGHCASVLSEREKLRAQSLLAKGSGPHFKQQRAFQRYCGALATSSALPLSQIAFATTANGRPYLPDFQGYWFSFSSCPLGYVGAWSSTHQIGVDIEDQTTNLEATEIAQAYFSRAEAKTVEDAGELVRMRTFFQLWTFKEAALKSIGEGLPFGLDAFRFELYPSIRMIDAPRAYGGPERFSAYTMEKANSCIALVIRSGS